MHGSSASLCEASAIVEGLRAKAPTCRTALFPPAPLIHRMSQAVGQGPLEIGAQDCRGERSGPFTGDISAEMLRDAGATLVILGHSERRSHHRESDDRIADKVAGALRGGLEPIVCVGETLEQRRAGMAVQTITSQIRASLPADLGGHRFTIAYEPCWAIGTGLTPQPSELEDMHGAIHEILQGGYAESGPVAVLYGGSVTPANAAGLMQVPGVDGALVGGASLKAADFLAIVSAATA